MSFFTDYGSLNFGIQSKIVENLIVTPTNKIIMVE